MRTMCLVSCAILFCACAGQPDRLGEQQPSPPEEGSGRLRIEPREEDGSVDAEAEDVAGDIVIESPEQLDALQGVRIIFGDLTINGGAIDDLSALDSLEQVMGFLSIRGTTALRDLTGLSALRQVGDLVIEETGLVSLRGLDNLQRVGGLRIYLNRQLESLAGMSHLVQVDWQLSIVSNFAMASLEGLESVHELGGELRIAFMSDLTDLDGLRGLVSVGAVHLEQNQSLTSLAGLGNLHQVRDRFAVVSNRILPSCRVESLQWRLESRGWSGEIEEYGNGTGGPCDLTELDGTPAPVLSEWEPAVVPFDLERRPYPQAWIEEAQERHDCEDCQHLVYRDECRSVRTGVVELRIHLDEQGHVGEVESVRNSIRLEPEVVFACLDEQYRGMRFRPPGEFYQPHFTLVIGFSDMC